jgi:hypothetical protein
MDEVRIRREASTADLSAVIQRFTQLFAGSPAMLEQWSQLTGELAQFMTARWMKDLDTMRAMSQCRGPAEMIELQLRWVQGAFDDYMAETNRLMERNATVLGSFVRRA